MSANEYPFRYMNYEKYPKEKIATLTFRNPGNKGNTAPFWAADELIEAVDDWEQDDDVKVVILKGEGDHFCMGHDLNAYLGGFHLREKADGPKRRPSNREQLLVQRKDRESWRRLFYSYKPTIAQVQGGCIEYGNQIQLCCDITIAAEDAEFGNLGQTAGIAGITLIRMYTFLIGMKRTREMMLSGRVLSGIEAERIGLINRVVPKEQLADVVMNEARRIAIIPIDGLVTGKAYTHLVFDSMGMSSAFVELPYGHMLGLKMRFEPDEFWFFDEIRKKGASATIKKRREIYAPLGGYGVQFDEQERNRRGKKAE